MLHGSCTPGMRPHFEVIPRHPRVVYPQNAPSLCGHPACSEGRVPSECTFCLGLSCMLRGSRALEMHVRLDAFPHAPKVAYPQNAPSL